MITTPCEITERCADAGTARRSLDRAKLREGWNGSRIRDIQVSHHIFGPPAQTVDVAPILDKAVAAKGEKLEWRTSIVDLMKALDIDSSFSARKELAKELGYTGDSNDSATMNIWLH